MKLDYKKTTFIGFAFMSICAFWQIYDSVIPKILENTFNMGETDIGIIMALDNIFAIFLLPLFGTLSDRCKSKFGKRTPFIVIGTLLAVVIMVFLPFADQAKNLPMFIVLLLGVLLSMAVYRSPAVALMPDLTPKPLRSKANAVINLMGTLGGIIALGTISITKPSVSGTYVPVFVIIAAVMAMSIAVLLITVKEKKEAERLASLGYDMSDDEEEEKAEDGKMDGKVLVSLVLLLISVFLWFFAYNAVTSTFSRYTADVWGDTQDLYAGYTMVGTVAATLAYFPIALISTKFGRKKVILSGITLMLIAFASGYFVKEISFVAYIIFGIVGIGWAAINVNSYPMVVEMSRSSSVGKYTGYYYTFSMAAQILTPILSGFLIENTKMGYTILFPYAAVFMALAFITMLLVKHGDGEKASA